MLPSKCVIAQQPHLGALIIGSAFLGSGCLNKKSDLPQRGIRAGRGLWRQGFAHARRMVFERLFGESFL
jgi:hypothetical protein